MKYWLLAFSFFLSVSSYAGPYFRLIDPVHPHPVAGAFIDPYDLGNTSAATLLPLVTHSTSDGCIFPSIICENWTPLALGGSMNAGHITFDVAPLANVVPWVQNIALAVIPSSWTGLVNIIEPKQGQPVTFSAGPVWEYNQLKDKGYFKVFTGLQLNF